MEARFALEIFVTLLVLVCFLDLFNDVNPLIPHPVKRSCVLLEGNIAHLAWVRAIRTLIFLQRDCFVFLCTQNFRNTSYSVPIKLLKLLADWHSTLTMLHIVIALSFFTVACNVLSFVVEVVNSAMGKVGNFSEYELITVYFKLFPGRNSRFVVFNLEQQTTYSKWKFNKIWSILSKGILFRFFFRSNLSLGFR